MRLQQMAARPRRLVPPGVLSAGAGAPGAGGDMTAARGLAVDPAPPSGAQPAPHLDGTFRAFGCSRAHGSPSFWTDGSDGLQFLFHLHAFAALAAYTAGVRSAGADAFWSRALDSWLTANAVPHRPAWHPFPTSGRMMAWCAALAAGGWDRGLEARMRASLWRQATLLRRAVEHDIGGNHVLRNTAALVFAGICLGDRRAESRGLAMLERELPRQVLADGGHEERSPAYHQAVLSDLEDVAMLLQRAGRPHPPQLGPAIEGMRAWLAALAGPDGRVPMFNDAWEIPPVASRSTDAFVDLGESGYVVLRHGGDQAILDVGPLCPPHLPPHAHADALSFVLWADVTPLVTDPGSFTYAGPERDAFRGSAAHATLEVDGADQCDFWGAFRAAHLPHVRRLRLDRGPQATIVTAEHDGFRRLADPVTHRRTFCWLPGWGIVVADRLVCRAPHDVRTRLPLAPGTRLDDGKLGPLAVEALGSGSPPRVVATRHSPYLGTAVSSNALERRFQVRPGETFGWALLRPGAEAELDAGRLRVTLAGRRIVDTAA
jgi:uncharacterized heparinase superfamily protein